MTPKLKLSEHARKTLLSWIRKLALPGMRRTKASTQMMDAPKTQASGSESVTIQKVASTNGYNLPTPLTLLRIHPRVSLSTPLASNPMASLCVVLSCQGRVESGSAAAATVLYVGCWQVCGVLRDINDCGCIFGAVFCSCRSALFCGCLLPS